MTDKITAPRETYLEDNIRKLSEMGGEEIDERVEKLAKLGSLGGRPAVEDQHEAVQIEMGLREKRDDSWRPSSDEMSERRREWKDWIYRTDEPIDIVTAQRNDVVTRMYTEFVQRYPELYQTFGVEGIEEAFTHITKHVTKGDVGLNGGRATIYEHVARRLRSTPVPSRNDAGEEEEIRTDIGGGGGPAAAMGGRPAPEKPTDMIGDMRFVQEALYRKAGR